MSTSALETERWCLTKGARRIRCTVRTVENTLAAPIHRLQPVGVELRVEHNGEMYLTELHKDRVPLEARVKELRAMLEAKGWTSA